MMRHDGERDGSTVCSEGERNRNREDIVYAASIAIIRNSWPPFGSSVCSMTSQWRRWSPAGASSAILSVFATLLSVQRGFDRRMRTKLRRLAKKSKWTKGVGEINQQKTQRRKKS